MKLLTNAFFFLSISSFASIQIDYVHLSQAKTVQHIFQENYSIPSDLLVLKKVNNCDHNGLDRAIAHLCINKKGELKLLSYKKDMIKNSLKIFQNNEVL